MTSDGPGIGGERRREREKERERKRRGIMLSNEKEGQMLFLSLAYRWPELARAGNPCLFTGTKTLEWFQCAQPPVLWLTPSPFPDLMPHLTLAVKPRVRRPSGHCTIYSLTLTGCFNRGEKKPTPTTRTRLFEKVFMESNRALSNTSSSNR